MVARGHECWRTYLAHHELASVIIIVIIVIVMMIMSADLAKGDPGCEDSG